MIDLYVYDKNLNHIGIVDDYYSLIWAKRYSKVGDCEVALAATTENIALLQKDYYIGRRDDDMLCRIMKIEIDTNVETGNNLIVTGYDVKKLLDQRIIWRIATCNGKLELFIRRLVTNAAVNPADDSRKFKKENGYQLLFLGAEAGLTVRYSEQICYKNLGEKIREYCNDNQWGYRVIKDGTHLNFELYAGADKSNLVKFSPQFDNIATSKYLYDTTGQGNVALIGNQDIVTGKDFQTLGTATGVNRYEQFVNSKDIGKTVTWAQMKEVYPNGELHGTQYWVDTLDVQVMDDNHLLWLQSNFPMGSVIYIDSVKYYEIEDAYIGNPASVPPDDNTDFVYRPVIYNLYLLQLGAEKIKGFGERQTFEGVVIPDVTFIYKQDYNLGDIVTVENEYGISAQARITEVLEVVDGSGYSVEPKFEYIGG